jgi:hypothetical protein
MCCRIFEVLHLLQHSPTNGAVAQERIADCDRTLMSSLEAVGSTISRNAVYRPLVGKLVYVLSLVGVAESDKRCTYCNTLAPFGVAVA